MLWLLVFPIFLIFISPYCLLPVFLYIIIGRTIFATKIHMIMCKFSESTKQKLGNAIVYIARHASNFSKTKLLKFLYLMEERMALKYHVPFIGIPYEV